MRNERGEGLISVMISVAILGVLVVAIVSMYQMYGSLMSRSYLRREADNMINEVRSIISRRQYCKQALAGNIWHGLTGEEIIIRNAAGVPIAQENMVFGHNQLRMKKVVLRPFQIAVNGGAARSPIEVRHEVDIGGDKFRSQSGEIVIRFEPINGSTGAEGDFAERRAAVRVLVDKTNSAIVDCDLNEEQTAQKQCQDVSDASADSVTECASAPPYAYECSRFFFIGAVDATGQQKCNCVWSCDVPYYQDRKAVSPQICSNTSSISSGYECPSGVFSGSGSGSGGGQGAPGGGLGGPPSGPGGPSLPPGPGPGPSSASRTYCRGQMAPGSPQKRCLKKVNNVGVCGPTRPWLLMEATCLPQ